MTKLLIVEDHAPTRQSLRGLLGDMGEIYECEDGEAAFSAYERYRPDWVLMDLKMKRKGGLQATREIVAAYPEARVVIVTLYGDEELRAAAREAGACGYVVKDNLLEVRQILTG
jgi:DNA-binding NarL/FixJ family response regulator